MPDAMQSRTRILEKLERARAEWAAFSARSSGAGKPDSKDSARFFGAQKHQFRLLPCLTSAALHGWEEKFQVELPEDYRFFVTRLGGGGAGPYYGVSPLQSWATTFHGDTVKQRAWLKAPCLLREKLPLGEAEWASLVAGPDWEDKFNRDEWEPGLGTLPIVEKGCGGEISLILNGPLRGRLCHLEWLNSPVICDEVGFLGWYERWLDEVLGRAVVLF